MSGPFNSLLVFDMIILIKLFMSYEKILFYCVNRKLDNAISTV